MKTILYFLLLLCNYPINFLLPDTGREFVITFEKCLVVSNNQVGDDWYQYLKIRDHVLEKGEQVKITLVNRAPLLIEAEAIEEDANYSDNGSKVLELTYSELIAINKQRFVIEVNVVENGGQYAGNVAVLKFFFGVEQVE